MNWVDRSSGEQHRDINTGKRCDHHRGAEEQADHPLDNTCLGVDHRLLHASNFSLKTSLPLLKGLLPLPKNLLPLLNGLHAVLKNLLTSLKNLLTSLKSLLTLLNGLQTVVKLFKLFDSNFHPFIYPGLARRKPARLLLQVDVMPVW